MRSETRDWVARGAGLAIGVGIIVGIVLLAARAFDVILLVFFAILLGAGLEPVVGWLRARLHLPRAVAILLVYAAFLIAVAVVAVLVVPAASLQLERAVARLPDFLESVRGWTRSLRPEIVSEALGSLLDAAEAPFRPAPPPDPESVVGASFALASGAAALVTLLVLVFFWLTGRSRLQRYALAFVPVGRRAGVREGWNEVESRLGLWVRGQLILMATIGIAAGIAYALIGVPAAVLLGLVAAIAEAIPIVGPLIGAIPAVLLATSVSTETAVLTLAVYAVLQFVEGNVVLPIVMRNAVGLSPFLVLVSLLVGFSVGGVLGAVVAVPIVAAFEAVLERLQDRETPVAIELNADQAPSEEERDAMEKRAPDSVAAARGVPTRSDAEKREGSTRPRRPSRSPRRSTG